MGKKRKALPTEPVEARIESLTHEGRGLARIAGKTVFIDGALAGERVRFQYTRCRRAFDEGRVLEVLEPASQRVLPRCPHFGICGGCSLQHLDPNAQIQRKQEILGEVLRRIGHVEPERWLAPLSAKHWGYRRKARLGVRRVEKKGRTLLGFRERNASFLADLRRCEVLHPQVGARIEALADLLDRLSIRKQIPQVEMAMGEGPCVLVLRTLQPPNAADRQALVRFSEDTGLYFYLQPGGPESLTPLTEPVDLQYLLPKFGVRIHFAPTDFTQVHLELNRRMVDQALNLLDPQPEERILDLFCGVGNFTLPLAKRAAWVLGIEGNEELVARARQNAARNRLENLDFQTADLQQEGGTWAQGRFHKALLDPPRSGAWAVLDQLPALGVQRLLYVSCFPATLARDADRLVHQLGYRLEAAGAMDMFPHTAHVEAMAVFERNGE